MFDLLSPPWQADENSPFRGRGGASKSKTGKMSGVELAVCGREGVIDPSCPCAAPVNGKLPLERR